MKQLLTKYFLKMKMNPNIEPVGTVQLVQSQLPGGRITWNRYHVIGVTGNAKHAPSADGPTIHMELGERQPGHLQQYLSMPLFLFDKRVMANTVEDQFWISEKGDSLEVLGEEEA